MEQQNQQPKQEKIESKPPMKTNWKFIAIVAVIAVVVSVGGILLLKATQPAPAAQVLQPTPMPSPQPQVTEGWQTYRNDELGFEVKYPASWQFEELVPSLSFGGVLGSTGPQKGSLNISVGRLSYTGIDDPEIVYQQEVFAGKTTTVQSIYKEKQLIAKNIEVSLTSGGYITIGTTPDSNGSFSTIDQILSTFRFVE